MKEKSVGLVLLWMAGALVCFSSIAVAVRELARTLSIFEILALRTMGGLAILLLAAALHRPFRSQFGPGSLPLQITRNVIHFGGQYAWSYGLTLLPLATVFALEFTAPVFLAILAVPLLGERLTASRIGAVVLGLAGVLLILRPGQEAVGPGAFVVLGAALSFAAVAVATKRLTRLVSTFTILLWMNAVQLAMNLVGSAPDFPSRIEPGQWPAAALLVTGGLGSHLCLTQAYRNGDATVVMPLDFLRIPLIALVGWRFYGEALDPLVFAGAVLIVGGIAWNLAAEGRGEPATPSRTPGSARAS